MANRNNRPKHPNLNKICNFVELLEDKIKFHGKFCKIMTSNPSYSVHPYKYIFVKFKKLNPYFGAFIYVVVFANLLKSIIYFTFQINRKNKKISPSKD